MRKFIFLIYVCLFVFNWGKAWSLIEVDITRGNLNPLPLAVSPLSVDQNSKEKFKDLLKLEDIGVEISKVVENNLRQSGLFNPLDPKAFLQKPKYSCKPVISRTKNNLVINHVEVISWAPIEEKTKINPKIQVAAIAGRII